MLWTYIVRCSSCGQEVNRAEHVPENKRTLVALNAALMCHCPNPEHNTASDFNLHFTGEWVAEDAQDAQSPQVTAS